GCDGPGSRGGRLAQGGALARELWALGDERWQIIAPGPVKLDLRDHRDGPSQAETLVYVAPLAKGPDLCPDLLHAQAAFAAFREAGVEHAVIVSRRAVYAAT